MKREYVAGTFAKLCDARDTLCSFCECGDYLAECEHCMVSRLIDDAYNTIPDKEGT